MAYSMDLRDRVLALYDEGVKTKQVAEQLRISPAWARRVKQRRDRPPRKVGGSVPRSSIRRRGPGSRRGSTSGPTRRRRSCGDA